MVRWPESEPLLTKREDRYNLANRNLCKFAQVPPRPPLLPHGSGALQVRANGVRGQNPKRTIRVCMQFWKEMEGKTVAGRYALGTLLRSTEQSAWFAAKDDRQKPWVAFLTKSASDEDQVLKNLEAASRVKHANVVGIEKTGRQRIDDLPLVYAILEPTEENLAEVLRERALTPEETAEITSSLVAGLTAIHEQGLFHGHVDPAFVMASGDTVKLSSDCLQKPAVEARADSFAQDTGDLGATVFQALTQRTLTSPDDPAINKLPVPFRSIVHSSVIGRWGLTDIAAALKKPGLEEIRHPIPNVETAAKPKFAEESSAKAVAPVAKATVAKPVVEKQEKTPARAAVPASLSTDAVPAVDKGRSTALRIVAIIALIAAIGVIWFFYRSRTADSDTAGTATSSSAPATAAQTTPAPDASAPEQPASAPPASSMTPAPRVPATVASTNVAPAGDHKIWRVVVYTFANKSAAEHKVTALTAEHPDLKPEVFSAHGQGPWLVTVGGPMDRAQAFQMRGQVRSQGMPGDSYAQNYSH